MKNGIRFLFLSVFLLTSAVLFAQNEVLLVRGLLKDEETLKKLEGVKIIVFQNGSSFDEYDAGTSGKFNIEVPLGYSYDIKFTRENYVSKIVRFDTRNIPPEDKVGGFQNDMDIKLFPLVEGFNTDLLKEPIGIASFDDQENNISFDFKYTEKMQEKIKAEFDRLKKLAADGDKMKVEYDKLMQEGAQKMIEEKYQDAMARFDGALKLFPKDGPAKQKYDEAKAKYDALLAAQKRDADYQRLLTEGQSYIDAKKYAEAKKSFQDASALKKEEKFPKEKLYEIDKLMEKEAQYAKYQAVIKDADAKFGTKDYAVAMEKYREASALIPSENYPKDQVAKCQAALDGMLADEARRQQMEKRYQDLITLGDRNLGEKNYDAARLNFEEALRVKPEEKYPKDKLAAIDKLLADLDKKAAANAAAEANADKERIDREYNEHIKAADKFFKDSKEENADLLGSAKGEYELASALKPQEKYPQAKINLINDILSRLEASASAAGKEAEDKNAERLRQEEEMRKKKEEMEKQAEEQRNALLAEEERKRREKEAAREAEAEANRRRGGFLKADSSEEQAVDAYYRKAREIEEDAKYKALQEKEDLYAQHESTVRSRAEDLRLERIDQINSQKDRLSTIYRTGDGLQEQSTSELNRLKEQDARNTGEYATRAEQRQQYIGEDIDEMKTSQESLSGNDRIRQASIDRQNRREEDYEASDELYRSRATTLLASNEAHVDRTEKAIATMSHNGEMIRQENMKQAEEEKRMAAEGEADVRSAAEVRLESAQVEVRQEKQMLGQVGRGKENLQEENIMEINEYRQNAELMAMEKEGEASLRRHQVREELFELDRGSPKKPDDLKPKPGSETLPEGVTENSYEYTRPSRKVIERVVKRGNKVDTYRKVVSKTGIFYFKNDKSITEEMWVRETLKATE